MSAEKAVKQAQKPSYAGRKGLEEKNGAKDDRTLSMKSESDVDSKKPPSIPTQEAVAKVSFKDDGDDDSIDAIKEAIKHEETSISSKSMVESERLTTSERWSPTSPQRTHATLAWALMLFKEFIVSAMTMWKQVPSLSRKQH